ncbi:hypothetical protein N1851_010714 [Merluccius polli]|uniref:HAT C-terminal dimerisation domain-containing protein n=1 Tax=Merluccius polli TaxID=89951 RepID=A0AA47P368_MERPO|nr:hypothetical protein N1851_010714 [Merluccius polli]
MQGAMLDPQFGLNYRLRKWTWTSVRNSEPTQDSPPKAKIPRLLAKYKTHKKNHSTHGYHHQSVNSEVNAYLEDIQSCPAEEDALVFWLKNKDKYRHLHALAVQVLSVPASSAPVERVFCAGGLIMRPHRASLGSEMLSSLIFLKCNKPFL